ncbi:MAG: PEP-CTERM sorting domain-containing protein [Candidatus Korobacteraceae bacterium]
MKKLLLLVCLLSLSSLAMANATYTINFEQYSAYTQITNQYAAQDATFDNALQLVVPFYNYFDYPPHSGSGVITNDPNDPITITFSTPMQSVSFWYAAPDGIVATGSNGAVVDGAGVDGSNLQIVMPGYVSWITISANDGADSETVDDVSYTVAPEPGSLALLGSGVLGMAGLLRRKLVR